MSNQGEKPPKSGGEAGSADRAGGGDSATETPSFERLGQRIADLSRELSDITRLAGAGAPRKLELEAASAAFKSIAEAYAREPEAFSDAQLDLFGRQSDMLQQMSSGAASPEADADPRFADEAWRENPFFDFVRRAFLATSDWTENLAWNAPGLSEIERRRAAFFIRQATAAMAPSNLLTANPRALKSLFDSDGQSVKRGFANLQADFDASGGRLAVTQSDASAFAPGRNLAVTPGEVVLKNSLIELIRYFPTTETVKANPVLIFPPWINKYYVLDLTPQNSFVAWLRDQGFTVYMVSWRSADDETCDYDWDDYLREGGLAALDWVHAAHKAPVNAAGYCVGGALLSIMAARIATQKGRGSRAKRLASISLLAAQTDFSEPGDLGIFIDDTSVDGIAHLIDEHGGVMPGEAMRDAFNLLRPEDLIWRYVEERYLLGEAPKPFDLLYWNSDQTNLPGPLHLASLRRLYIDNALAKGRFLIEGEPVDLSIIKIPAFIHAARKDHISPFPSVYKGTHVFGGKIDFILADSGHIAGVVNPPSANKYRYWTGEDHPPTSDAWMAAATEHAGSWWPLWADWLRARSGEDVAPPEPIEGATPAPGDYVRETLESIAAKRAN
ncbi:MAG: poly-beta-hydroxybutyrate polymerase domain-containing protein [Alphaproteobacteria bacterium]|nr:poly-beta-hydroxybutyrate polymerase domain-containing protein [Alphaproteobacteria bacterium]